MNGRPSFDKADLEWELFWLVVHVTGLRLEVSGASRRSGFYQCFWIYAIDSDAAIREVGRLLARDELVAGQRGSAKCHLEELERRDPATEYVPEVNPTGRATYPRRWYYVIQEWFQRAPLIALPSGQAPESIDAVLASSGEQVRPAFREPEMTQ